MSAAAAVPPPVAVIGAGPAGLAAAEVLAAGGARVTLWERMPSPARKFLLAGNGGLNLTHGEAAERLLERFAEPRLRAAVAAFPPDALRAWAAGLGEETFVGSSGRVFPRSFKATPLLRAWLGRLAAAGVALRTRRRWTGWDADGALRFEGPDGPESIRAAAAVLALGGASWPRLGSDGSWAPLFGNDVAPLRPANCGFRVSWSEPFRARFAGAPLKRVAARFDGRTVRGEALVTAEGIEGGVVYALGEALRGAVERDGAAVLELDLRPDLDRAALLRRLGGPGVSTANALRRAGLDAAAAGLVREDATLPLADRIKRFPLRLGVPMPLARAISTAGGLRWDVLDGWMLRDRPGVFAAGEMLDWEAPTGGYLLQGSISGGRAAAAAALAWLGRPEGAPASGGRGAALDSDRD